MEKQYEKFGARKHFPSQKTSMKNLMLENILLSQKTHVQNLVLEKTF